jgi:hypothetical protein
MRLNLSELFAQALNSSAWLEAGLDWVGTICRPFKNYGADEIRNCLNQRSTTES